MIVKSGKFNVSILSQQAPFSVFEHFGFLSGHKIDKFAEFTDVARAENGLLYLTKYANSYISAKVTGNLDCDTHTIFYAEITGADNLSDEESITYDYYYKHTKPKVKSATGKYVCKICGYVYEGEELPADYICPLCKHGASDFAKMS